MYVHSITLSVSSYWVHNNWKLKLLTPAPLLEKSAEVVAP